MRPPADTPVLIGYVKTDQHLDWIRDRGWYNLRADSQRKGSVGLDSPEVGAEFIVLRGDLEGLPAVVSTSGSLAIRTREELESVGYPRPGGETYALIGIDRWLEPHEYPPITGEHVADLVERLGASAPAFGPIATTWLEVFGEIP
jgi:hypothetical protein